MSDKRDITAVCNEISDSLVEFLRQRFSIDEVITSQLVVFVRFDVDKTDLRADVLSTWLLVLTWTQPN